MSGKSSKIPLNITSYKGIFDHNNFNHENLYQIREDKDKKIPAESLIEPEISEWTQPN